MPSTTPPTSSVPSTTLSTAPSTSLVPTKPWTDNSILEQLYYSTVGESWAVSTNWIEEEYECTWFGVECLDGRVNRLDLGDNKLSGSIPTIFGQLDISDTLNLSLNDLTGSIPTEIGEIDGLLNLNMFSNNLTGTIPTEIGQLSNLQFLTINDNNLSGNIPSEIGQLS